MVIAMLKWAELSSQANKEKTNIQDSYPNPPFILKAIVVSADPKNSYARNVTLFLDSKPSIVLCIL